MARPKKAVSHGQVIRRWESSPIIYGFDSRFDRKPNPDHHAPISLTHKGVFIDDAGEVIDSKNIPAYILAEAKTTNRDIAYHPPARRDLQMRDAMTAAGVDDTDPDPKERAAARKRGVSRGVYA